MVAAGSTIIRHTLQTPLRAPTLYTATKRVIVAQSVSLFAEVILTSAQSVVLLCLKKACNNVHIVQILVYNHVHIVQVFVYNPFVQTLHIFTTMLDRGVAQLEGQNINNIQSNIVRRFHT